MRAGFVVLCAESCFGGLESFSGAWKQFVTLPGAIAVAEEAVGGRCSLLARYCSSDQELDPKSWSLIWGPVAASSSYRERQQLPVNSKQCV